MNEWRTDRPETHGYYLGAWLRHGRLVVSELWFNPDSIDTGWWSSRGYLHQDHAVPVDVRAWMPLPAAPEAK